MMARVTQAAHESATDYLLPLIADGDREAVQECIDRYGGLVWSLARRFTSTEPDAEDATQDIFLDIWKSASRFNPDVASETTFIAMIARRRLIDRRRKASRRPQSEVLFEDSIPNSSMDGGITELHDEAGIAVQELRKLSEDQQKVLRLSIFQGLTHERIAEATGMPLGTVKTHARRGLIKLRDLLASRKTESGAGSSGGLRLFPGSGVWS